VAAPDPRPENLHRRSLGRGQPPLRLNSGRDGHGRPEAIASFNPLSILKPGSDDFIEDLTYLADALIITQSTKDPYWEDTARELWAGLMAFVVEHPDYAPHASLPLARMLLMQSNEALQRTIRTAIGLGPGSVAALKLAQFDNPEKSTSIASVISAARTQTVFLDSPVLKQRMETSDFSFDQLCDGNISVYLVLHRISWKPTRAGSGSWYQPVSARLRAVG